MRPVGASLRHFGSAVNVTFSKCELAQEPITRRLDEREPAVSKPERVLGQLPDAPPVLPSPGSHGEHVLDRRDASLVAEASVEPKALFPQSLGAVVLAHQIRRSAVDPERLRAQLGRNRFRQVEQATEPAHALLGTGRVPDVLEPDGDLETQLWSFSSAQSSAARKSSRSARPEATSDSISSSLRCAERAIASIRFACRMRISFASSNSSSRSEANSRIV